MIENRAVNRVQAAESPVEKGRHCEQDESDDVEELKFGTWRDFCGESTSDGAII